MRFTLLKLLFSMAALCTYGMAQAQSWSNIATEGQAFQVSGTQTVRYGTASAWVRKKVKTNGQCTTQFFGSDPAPGVRKRCQLLNPTPKNGLGTNDPLGDKQWNLNAINLQPARNLLAGNTNKIRVAVLDTGYFNHPDIRWANDLDAAGRRILSKGDGSNSPHGAHVAGIIAGISNNGIGIAGVCDQCELIPVHTTLSDAGIAKSIRNAVRLGARVINMSFVNHNESCDLTEETKDAVEAATRAGVVLVSSAGNNDGAGSRFDPSSVPSQKDAKTLSPAGCPGVISVGATDQSGLMTAYSHRGAVIMAPGGGIASPAQFGAFGAGYGCEGITETSTAGIVSAWWSGLNQGAPCYRHLSGTSMSAPHVTGVVGLMLAANPGLTPKQIKDILVAQATPIPGCTAALCGAGLVNAGNAVAAALQTTPAPLSANEWRPATYKGVCKYAVSLKNACELDTIDELPNGNISVTAYGFMWNYSPSGALLSGPTLLNNIPAYARTDGPCYFTESHPNEDVLCRIDARTVVEYPGIGYIDSINARGNYWNFDAAGNPLGQQGLSWLSVPRYTAICPVYYLGSPPCRFDHRTLVNFPEWGGVVESIGLNGRYYNFDGAGNMLPGAAGQGALTSIARYGQICALNTSNQPCKFDTRELKANRNEVITAYGQYFEFSGDTLVNRYELKSPTFCVGPAVCNPFQ